jgi:hypothetical protein
MALGVNEATRFIATTFQPLRDWVSDDHIKAYVDEIGWTLPSVPSGFRTVRDSAEELLDELANLLEADEADDTAAFLASIAKIASFVTVVVGNIDALPNSIRAELPSDFVTDSGIANDISERLLDRLLYDGIRLSSHTVKSVLFALGILDETAEEEDTARHQPRFVLRRIILRRIGLLFTNPAALMGEVYGWGTTDINVERLVGAIQQLSFGLLGEPDVIHPSPQFLQGLFPGVPIPPEGPGEMIAVSLMLGVNRAPLAIGAIPAPKASPSERQGVALRLLGAPDLSFSLPVTSTMALNLSSELALDTGVGVVLRPDVPPTIVQNVEAVGAPVGKGKVSLALRRADATHPVQLFRFAGASDLRARTFFAEVSLVTPPSDLIFRAGLEGGVLNISLGQADGFVRNAVPSSALAVKFDLAIGWSKVRGVFLTGSAGLEVVIPLHLTLGPVGVQAFRLLVSVDDQGLRARLGADVDITLGPLTGSLQGIGVQSLLQFAPGNLGPMDLDVDFLAPTGMGIRVDAGAVTGGGFLSFDHANGRYSGIIELSVYRIAVKAFGLLETKLPDGRKGYSFAIVISAEFTPVQLGFGFTLLGVGGLIGINRSLNDEGLAGAVRTGSLENILFPHNPERDAPAIIHDLATIFPASPGHFVLGPLAKLGWGTPTLIDAELGIVLELPGPRLAVLGVVHMALPTKQAALLSINLAVAGVLDFPKKLFAIDASLYDSQVVGFTIRGDMAFRLSFGDEPNFALSIGGLHPTYQPPPGFPELRRVSIDLGINGNPSLTASGYFALTSNTAQVGAAIDLHASGFGINLDGHLGFDALFVFSPFSFVAGFSAGVRVSFHGVGLGVGLHGSISGPTPWHVSASACVSVLFWDACLPIDVSFGTNRRAELPEMDPWLGNSDSGNLVMGLEEAITRATNWSGGFPAGAHQVVTLTEDPSRTEVPIDPVGQAKLRQKVLPLNYQLTKFGIYKPITNTLFRVDSVKVGGQSVPPPQPVKDKFAPALFKDMGDAEKLSSKPYENFDAGFVISPDAVTAGDIPSHAIEFDTEIIDDQRNTTLQLKSFQLTDRHLNGMASRGASALAGVRRSGPERFVDPTARVLMTFSDDDLFVVADACSAEASLGLTGGIAVGQAAAQNALDAHVSDQPSDRGRFQVIPSYFAAA